MTIVDYWVSSESFYRPNDLSTFGFSIHPVGEARKTYVFTEPGVTEPGWPHWEVWAAQLLPVVARTQQIAQNTDTGNGGASVLFRDIEGSNRKSVKSGWSGQGLGKGLPGPHVSRCKSFSSSPTVHAQWLTLCRAETDLARGRNRLIHVVGVNSGCGEPSDDICADITDGGSCCRLCRLLRLASPGSVTGSLLQGPLLPDHSLVGHAWWVSAGSSLSTFHPEPFLFQELLLEFECETQKREHEFRLRADGMSNLVLMHELKVMGDCDSFLIRRGKLLLSVRQLLNCELGFTQRPPPLHVDQGLHRMEPGAPGEISVHHGAHHLPHSGVTITLPNHCWCHCSGCSYPDLAEVPSPG